MKKIQTEIVIKADIAKVWSVLMDFEKHSDWNPFIQSIQGEKKVGGRLHLFIQPPKGKGMSFKPTILTLEPFQEFRWKGSLGIKGIFDGEHYFLLESLSKDQTKLIHGEKFSGLLVLFMAKVLEKTKFGFQQMNESLKKECEK